MAGPRSEGHEVTVRDFSFGFPCFAACVLTNFRVLLLSVSLPVCLLSSPGLRAPEALHCLGYVQRSDATVYH